MSDRPRYTLTLAERRSARRKARRFWIESGGNSRMAEQMFRTDPDMASLDPQTILLLLQIALKLWLWWREQNISEPSESPVDGEPCCD